MSVTKYEQPVCCCAEEEVFRIDVEGFPVVLVWDNSEKSSLLAEELDSFLESLKNEN